MPFNLQGVCFAPLGQFAIIDVMLLQTFCPAGAFLFIFEVKSPEGIKVCRKRICVIESPRGA
jgi:hypothetical protein